MTIIMGDLELEQHKEAIQSTWKAVEESLGVGATELFYKRLFEEYPEVKPMFPTGDFDMNEQAEKLFKTMSMAVDYLNDVPALIPVLEDLGKKVSQYSPVLPNYFDFDVGRFIDLIFFLNYL